eukprot:TRINITY_DN16196_c0_g1_i1.p1 TRINITY_DN16196_c0_g1~~TRINITY_DN16196_c0_g1_i1.p1  ORF type:complete len:1514 (-),score=442.75 TRINITY_DN16196_c0_g1_i1:68-4609(-)
MEAAAGGRRRRGAQEETPYVKYLKYKQSGFSVGPAGKTTVWIPSADADRVYDQAEVTKDDNKNFTYRTAEGQEKTLEKNEKNYMGVNPAKFDGVEDMGELGHLNEPAVLYNLKKRYDADLFHTYSGLFLVVVNPYKRLPIYTKEIIDVYRGRPRDKVAPHIFAISDTAYRAMIQTGQNQSMLITGESGAGKTENTKKVIQYLAAIAGRSGEGTLEQQLLEFNPILEAFGNAKTTKNNNSSRFGKFIELQFNSGGQIAGANTLIYLLEKSRVVFQAPIERNFHVFYQMLSSAMPAETKQRLHLQQPQDYFYLNQSSTFTIPGVDDGLELQHSLHALQILGITAEETQGVWETLAGILWLGNLTFEENAREVAALAGDPKALQYAAEIFGVPADKLSVALLSPRIKAGNEYVSRSLNKVKAAASRDALAKGLYGRLFNWVVKKINNTLSHPSKKAYFIGVLDISGFEIFEKNSFEQLCINYTNEKLQQFFNHHMFTLEQEEYEREKIEWSFINYGLDLQDTIDLIEKKPLGILSILDEQTVFPDATDTTFTKKLHDSHESHRNFRKPRFVANNFKIVHYAGTVEYETADWLEKNRDPLEEDLLNLFKQSSRHFVTGLFDESLMPSYKAATPAPVASGRSGSSGRQPQRAGGAIFMSVAAQYKEQLTHLMDTLRSTSPHFIRCILPNSEMKPGLVNNKLVLHQLKCNGVLEGIRIARKGFPNRHKYAEFLKRYYLLKPGATPSNADAKGACKDLIDHLIKTAPDRVKPDLVRFGVTKIFFRAGQLALIEEMREKLLSQMIISVQTGVRAFLARRLYEKMREQTISAKILQRNIRAFLELRNWPWWHLYVKARPLISQRNFQGEIDALQKQVKELQKQVDDLTKAQAKLEEDRRLAEEDCDRLQGDLDKSKARISELEAEKTDLEADLELLQKKVKNLEDELQEETAAANELLNKVKSLEESKTELELNLEDETKRKKEEADGRKKAEAERDDWKGKYEEEKIVAEANKSKGDNLNRDLLKAQDDIFEQENIAETLRTKLKNTEGALKQLQSEHADLNKSKGELERDKKKLTEDLEESERQLAENKAGRESANENVRRLTAQLDEANNDLASVKNKLSNTEKNLKGAKSQERDLEEQLEDERTVRGNVERQKKQLEGKVEELEDKISGLEKNKNDLSGQLRSLQAEKDDLSRKYDEAAGNAARYLKDKKNLEEDLQEAENSLEEEREKGRREKRRADQQVAELKAAYEAAPKGGASSEEVRKLEDDVDDLTVKLRSAEVARDDAEKDARQLALELADYKGQLEDADRNSAKLTNEVRKLQGDLAAARESQDGNEDSKNVLELAKRKLEGEVEELKRKLAKEQDARVRAEDSRDAGNRDSRALKKEIEALERKNAGTEREARDFKNKVDDIRHRLESEERAKTKLQDQLRDLRKLLLEREQVNQSLIGQLHTSNDDERRSLEAEVAILREKNDRLTDRIDQLQDEFDGLFKKLGDRKAGGSDDAPAAAAESAPAAGSE